MQSIGSRQAVVAAATLALLSTFWLAPSAAAAPPDFVLQMPEGQTDPGSGAAQLDFPTDIAGNPETGHVYIAELSNARISEYTAWGLFVRAWGWGVMNGALALQTCAPAQPEAEPPAGLCQAGKEGSGEGQFKQPFGVAVDAAGDVYVFDSVNLRVQKFSEDGEFLLMFGGKVNQTKVGEGAPAEEQNRCPVDPGDVCQAGTSGEAPSHFATSLGNNIAYSATADAIVVGDKDRIQIFQPDGTFEDEIPFEGELGAFAGKAVNALDVDLTGNIYLTLPGLDDVYKLSPAGVPLDPGKPTGSKFKAVTPQAVAVDASGNVYTIDDPGGTASNRVLEFDAAGNRLVPTAAEEANGEFFPYIPFHGPLLRGLGTNICAGSEVPGNLYVVFSSGLFGAESLATHVDAYGTAPVGCEPPPARAPEIVAQFASAVGREEATVRAQINPRFWQDATYYVEYGTGKCSDGGCGAKEPVSAALLTSKAVNKAVTSGGVVLEGLEPGTTYHYRFVAKSSGGGPVFGEDPDGKEGPEEASFEAGAERTFKTFAAQSPAPDCANDAFRTAPSSNLPDCRAYEMVSPLEKGNADVALWVARSGLVPRLYELDQSAVSGNAFAFTSATAFGDAEGAAFVTEYLARRGEDGWASDSISSPRTVPPVGAEPLLGGEFQGFSEDLCMAWLRHYSVAPLAEGAVAGYPNLYRRENCSGSGTYEALTTGPPSNRSADKYLGVRWHGASQDGSHAIFTANGKLHPQAPNVGAFESLLYEHTPEGLRFVCYLPSGNPSPLSCTAGTGAGNNGGNESSTHNAISADGTKIFWSAASGAPGPGSGIPGQIYARIEGTQTIKVSGVKSTDPAWYWTAADDGSKVIFAFASGTLKDELYEFDLQTETAQLIAKGVLGPLGASEDASRIYFASSEDLDGGGEASKGARNLYLYQADESGGEGSFTFIMALAKEDVGQFDEQPGPIDELPVQRSARISPDGLHAVFVSMASPTPTGYDNLDTVSSQNAQEAYLYDAVEEELRCISCNPSGARPVAEDLGADSGGDHDWAAARIQGWEALGHAPRILSGDGARAYFESFEALAPRDTNGTWDVYQWEEAGKGGCTGALDTFSPAAQGCIDLISSGDSPAESIFLDADPSGENVFFGTLSSLVKADYGLNDVYDARVGGGFPDPTRETECEGEACQSPPPPPPAVTPSSEAFEGPQNPSTKPKRKRCKAGTRKVKRGGKVRCVKKKAKRQTKRRAGR